MAGVSGVRNIAAAAGVDPREVVALLRSGGDMRLLACRAMAHIVEERRSGELETAAAAKEPDVTAFIRSATEIH
jgi:carbamoylphosphate synthase small subunit